MIEILVAIFSAGTLAGVGWFGYQRFIGRSHLKHLLPGDIISMNDFAIVERDIKNLKKVIIVCDVLEKPSDLLYDSIRDNLAEKVEYHFFVSDDQLEVSCSAPLQFFENAERLKLGLKPEESTSLTRVHGIGHNRHDKPYVFLATGDGEHASVVCFKGMDVGVGIAKTYVLIDADDARNLYNLLAKSYPRLLNARSPTDFVRGVTEGMIDLRGRNEITPSLRVVGRE